jgi:hypothetical protein
MSRRASVWVAISVAFSVALVDVVIGPYVLKPLPLWVQLLIVVLGAFAIAAIAVYSRRRAARSAGRT